MVVIIVAITHYRFDSIMTSARSWWSRASNPALSIAERSVPITVPRVERSTGISVRLNQLAVITTQPIREVAISWGGSSFAPLTVILVVLGPRAMAHLGVPVIPTMEQMTSSWVGHTGEILWMIVPLLTAFYAGELVWRDREIRLSEIAYAAPVPEWVQPWW